MINALFLGAGVYIFGSLARQISARRADPSAETLRGFSWGDAVLAALLASWFVLNITASASHNVTSMRTRDLAANALVSIALLLFVALFLRLRGFNLEALAGFSKIGFGRTICTGAVLLLAAYPLIFLADAISQRVLGAASEKQGIVELFNASDTLTQRVLIIVLAVAIAPVAEEFLFRFFLYGVLKRYLGRLVALLVSAALFAAVHAHLPSLAPLFVLGSCFTLAFEWSGSILVSMTMHALFNSLTLIALAFPELFQQQ
ncbi:MAG: CPBP family intramembrane metalloprotease [Verrucomicrobiota bacterium]|nr:CPBP family intramembrane metalloprotease [Verrucomicrobiota bacterium]